MPAPCRRVGARVVRRSTSSRAEGPRRREYPDAAKKLGCERRIAEGPHRLLTHRFQIASRLGPLQDLSEARFTGGRGSSHDLRMATQRAVPTTRRTQYTPVSDRRAAAQPAPPTAYSSESGRTYRLDRL